MVIYQENQGINFTHVTQITYKYLRRTGNFLQSLLI